MKLVVSGYGIVSAIGLNKSETLDSLLRERSGIGSMHFLKSIHTDLPVGEVKLSNEDLCQRLDISPDNIINRSSLLGIMAAREALTHASIKNVSEMAFISGTTVGGMDTTEQHYRDWQNNKNLEYINVHDTGATTDKIAHFIGNFAFTTTISTACSSALNSIITGALMILSGKCDKALVGGTESLSLFHLNGFNSLMILDHSHCKPFDSSRNGLNLGEGAAYIVIESEQSAKARGANIIAYLSGFANACDAFHQTASSPDGDGAFKAMSDAIKMAGISLSEIDYINAHGTGTINNDSSESAALHRIFGDQIPSVSSTKSFTGHTTSASGAIETVISLLALKNDFIPANLNFKNSAPDTITPICHTTHKKLNHIICNSFGFGGNDSSIIISQQGSDIQLEIKNCNIKTLAEVNADDSLDYKQFISPIEARRLTPQMRLTIASARQALNIASKSNIDAIICGTHWGCMINSMHFLKDMLSNNELSCKPTHFMLSTHNTMASLVAANLHCHSYNTTYSHGFLSLDHAIIDAKIQMQLGLIHSALIISFDEMDENWTSMLEKANHKERYSNKTILLCSD